METPNSRDDATPNANLPDRPGPRLGGPQAGPLSGGGDPRLPRRDDWGFRPYSASERFVEADEEARLAPLWLAGAPNLAAVVGVAFALAGFVAGFWGFLLALAGYVVSAVGLGLAAAGARRGGLALAGVAIAIIYLLGHTAELT